MAHTHDEAQPPGMHCIDAWGVPVQEGLFEEAGLLREREVDMKVRLGGLPHEAPQLPCVTLADVESVLSAWTGIPAERMSQDDRDRLSLMEPALKVCHCAQLVPAPCTQPWPPPSMLWIQSGALGGIWEIRWLIAIDGAKWATSLLTLTSVLAVLQIRSA